MRTISISTEVFAALWSKHLPGEESENAILERLLSLPSPERTPPASGNDEIEGGPDGHGGIYNVKFGVRFLPGFEIFRVYKGKRYVAVVRGGSWVMNGIPHPSLHKLSDAVVAGRENSWLNWKYRDEKGNEFLIDNLRRRFHD
jgi:hypothetical protein